MANNKKFYQYVLRSIIIFAIIIILLLGSGYAVLLLNSEELISKNLDEISQETGISFKFASIDINILPLPGLSVTNLEISNKNFQIKSAWAAVRPNFMKLLFGNFEPAKIVLIRPELSFQTELPLDDMHELFTLLTDNKKTDHYAATNGLKLENLNTGLDIKQAHVNIKGINDSSVMLSAFNCQLNYSANILSGSLGFAALRGFSGNTPKYSLENFTISGNVHARDFTNSDNNFNCRGTIFHASLIDNLLFDINYNSDSDKRELLYAIKGNLNLNSISIPISLSGKIHNLIASNLYVIRGFEWGIGADSGIMEAELLLPQNFADFTLDGTLMAKRISLTQWLGFARNLAPGLQLSLDNVLNSRLEFHINSKGLIVPAIEATCSGARFTGRGSVADFAKPVVFLDLKSESANLGLALGEALIRSPQPPWYGHPTLTPMPGEPLKPGETGIGYDINLAAKKLIYGPLIIRNAALRIYPGKIDDNGLEEVILDANSDFYGGKFKGNCILGGPADLPITITSTVTNVHGMEISRDMGTLPFTKGTFQAKVNIKSRGKVLKLFLNNLNGEVTITGGNVSLASMKDYIFNRINIKSQIRSASSNDNSVTFIAKWLVDVVNKDITGNINIDGPIIFSSNGAALKNLPVNASFKTASGLSVFPVNSIIKIKGELGGQTGTEKFTLNKAALNLLGLDITCANQVDLKKDLFEGNIKIKNFKISDLLSKLGYKAVYLPNNLNQLTLECNYTYKNDTLTLSKLKSKLGESALAGNIAWGFKKNSLQFQIDADKFNLEAASQNFTNKNSSHSSWDFPYFRTFNGLGKITVKNLYGWKANLTNLNLPLQLTNGNLSINSASGNIYNGEINISGNMNFNKGLILSSRLALKNINLNAATKERKINGVLLGQGNLDLSLNAALSGNNKFIPALNGVWNTLITGCSWQRKTSRGKDKPMIINRAQGQGKIENGVIKTNEIKLKGPDLEANGNGSLNLNTKQVDCKLEINMKGLPDFPLTIYGTYDNPKTSIGAGKMVLNAIGGIVGGIGDAISGIAKGIVNIFR